MAITSYAVVSGDTPSALDAAVTAAVAAGKQPFGQPFVHNDLICQAVIEGSQILVGAKGDTGATGAAGATFDVKTTAERDLLTPAEGDVIYNSTTKKLNVYNGTAWKEVTSAA